jgi:hypothetical protein
MKTAHGSHQPWGCVMVCTRVRGARVRMHALVRIHGPALGSWVWAYKWARTPNPLALGVWLGLHWEASRFSVLSKVRVRVGAHSEPYRFGVRVGAHLL